MDQLQRALTAAGVWMARPAAFFVVIAYLVLWLIFDRESLNFHGAVALITLCMTLFIQRSEHRDTQAIHAKLDELLRASDGANSGLTRMDDAEPERIEAHRDKARAGDV
jgi:low affinity Fe/Cu permease